MKYLQIYIEDFLNHIHDMTEIISITQDEHLKKLIEHRKKVERQEKLEQLIRDYYNIEKRIQGYLQLKGLSINSLNFRETKDRYIYEITNKDGISYHRVECKYFPEIWDEFYPHQTRKNLADMLLSTICMVGLSTLEERRLQELADLEFEIQNGINHSDLQNDNETIIVYTQHGLPDEQN